jgi:type VI secretion system protein ImpE
MKAREFFDAAQLFDAINAATSEVKAHPADVPARLFLSELLCFAGDLERADKQLDALAVQEPKAIMLFGTLRQLVRAEQARQQFFGEGRLPEFLDQPCQRLQLHLQASIAIREGRSGEAAGLLAQAEQQRPPVAGESDGRPFADLRDLDDLTSSFFEVLTSTGKYYWIPMERAELIEFEPPERPCDLLWRPAHMIVRDGPDGRVFLPALYAGSHLADDMRVRLGRLTEWRGSEGEPVRGLGQRMFLVDEEAQDIMELKTITIKP